MAEKLQDQTYFSPTSFFMVNKKMFLEHFGSKYSQAQIDKLDEDGVIKPNSTVEYGDILVAALGNTIPDKHKLLEKLSKNTAYAVTDGSCTYTHMEPGRVIEIIKAPRQISILTERTILNAEEK